MSRALYRDYRPRSFKQVIGQDHVTKTLERAIKAGRISHAYLFAGPRGVGKTSAARILAYNVNGLAYETESQHLDIIEIDAASNRRIDEVRDLREKARTAPASGKYKVYIIDEVHMLTREAFNALLKTLEEPPAHVIFILATTEAHKLPETIISRTQRFEFKPIAIKQMVKHLQAIAASEKVSITPGALELLAEFGRGSFRDSISLLDQMSTAGKISEDAVRENLGIPSSAVIKEIMVALQSGNVADIISLIQALKEQGVDPAAAANAIAGALRAEIIAARAQHYSTQLLKQLIDVPASSRPYDYLEICLLESAGNNQSSLQVKPDKPTLPPNASSKTKAEKVPRTARTDNSEFDISQWPEIVDSARLQAASIYTALRLAKPGYDNGRLVLKFEYPLHQKKLLQAKNKDLIAGLVEKISGRKVMIECEVDKTAFDDKALSRKEVEKQNVHSINHINNIFGNAEVVEA